MEFLYYSSGILPKEASFNNIWLVVVCTVFLVIFKLLWYAEDVPKIDLLYDDSSGIITKIISECKSLNKKYVPTYLWGKSGHFQSILHTFIGRVGSIPAFRSRRHEIMAPDGSVVSYDVFEPDENRLNELIIIVPGICNHAESRYVKAFSNYLNLHGFRVVVFNHTGALKSVELKRARIFTYGQTIDLDTVVKHLLATEKIKKFIAVGFSLGGNILMKYLGENIERQKHFHLAVSVCQGYNIPEAADVFREGENLRWIYNYGLTRNVLKIVNHHKEALASHCRSAEPPINLNWNEIFAARALYDLDEAFTLKLCKENDINAFYKDNSSSKYMNRISIPTLIINAKDDPIVPEKLFKYPKSLLNVNKNALFVVLPYGGHLGFFEGGYVVPNKISWLDRMLAEFIQVAVRIIKEESRNKLEENNNKFHID